MRRVTGYKDYTTREGDTFDALALEMYGEEMLAQLIRHNRNSSYYKEQ